eukprot:TRINITY_DN6035_c0_g2_i1.p1 TRINITY_DN6035_c0_g2~~TRINITY_DN6035_c0_g2_i1.p1  ORF type:complete len:706 (-),score=144.93 TRINITY_DN6035_c0_g2_i1:162-2279(-)
MRQASRRFLAPVLAPLGACAAAPRSSWCRADTSDDGASPPAPRRRTQATQEGEEKFWQGLSGEGWDASSSFVRVLRQDVLTKRWVCFLVDAKGGGGKPRQYKKTSAKKDRAHEQPEHVDKCPLCPGNEIDNEVLRIWPDGRLEEFESTPSAESGLRSSWLVRVLRNPFPYLLTPKDLYEKPFPGDAKKHAACFGAHGNDITNPDASDPFYPTVDAFGASEVVVESPIHNALIGISTDEQTTHALRAMAARGRTLRKHESVSQLLYFKQYGAAAGGSLVHPHMQVCSLPIVSGYMRMRLREHQDFYREHGCCAVQKLYVDDVCGHNSIMVARLLLQTEHFVASVPYAQVPRGRIVIAPKRHCSRFEDSTEEELRDLGALLRLLLASLYRLRDDPAYNLFWESAPCPGALGAEQDDDIERSFRWTLHVRVPPSISGFGLASGVEVTKQLPEQEAREIRGAILQELISPLRSEVCTTSSERPAEAAAAAGGAPTARPREFPETVGPFMMIQADLTHAFNAYCQRNATAAPDPSGDATWSCGLDLLSANAGSDDGVALQLSPVDRITLNATRKALASIPKEAEYYAWSYPNGSIADPLLSGSERAFLKYGGFVYFNERWEVVATTCISPAPLGTSLVFGPPVDLAGPVEDRLTRQGRFRETTLKAIQAKGAMQFAWIRPKEFGKDVDCPHGAFAYKFKDGPTKYYPIIG